MRPGSSMARQGRIVRGLGAEGAARAHSSEIDELSDSEKVAIVSSSLYVSVTVNSSPSPTCVCILEKGGEGGAVADEAARRARAVARQPPTRVSRRTWMDSGRGVAMWKQPCVRK